MVEGRQLSFILNYSYKIERFIDFDIHYNIQHVYWIIILLIFYIHICIE